MTTTEKPQLKPSRTEQRINKLEEDLALMAWLYAEFVHTMKVLIAQQMMQHPQVQQLIAQQLAAKMGAGGVAPQQPSQNPQVPPAFLNPNG